MCMCACVSPDAFSLLTPRVIRSSPRDLRVACVLASHHVNILRKGFFTPTVNKCFCLASTGRCCQTAFSRHGTARHRKVSQDIEQHHMALHCITRQQAASHDTYHLASQDTARQHAASHSITRHHTVSRSITQVTTQAFWCPMKGAEEARIYRSPGAPDVRWIYLRHVNHRQAPLTAAAFDGKKLPTAVPYSRGGDDYLWLGRATPGCRRGQGGGGGCTPCGQRGRGGWVLSPADTGDGKRGRNTARADGDAVLIGW